MSAGSNINKYGTRPKVMVAPLDWGLGHVTRCVPVIKYLIDSGIEVILAAEGNVAALLQQEFTQIRIVPLRGYRIRYSKNAIFLILGLILQLPRIIMTYLAERRFIQKMITQEGITAIISDNRPGLFHKKINSIYLTHQLNIKTNSEIGDKIATSVHQFFIKKFSECWVPDEAGKQNLAGALSHTSYPIHFPVKYIGNLSRFSKLNMQETNDLLILLSGPEPQRSILENKLLNQLSAGNRKVIFVRGLPGDRVALQQEKNIIFHNHLSGEELNKKIESSKIVIARCGYSTVMDLAMLQKKAILIPTPCQTEQEYLASYLSVKGYFYTVSQEKINLEKDLQSAMEFRSVITEIKGLNKEIIDQWINQIIRQ